MPGELMIHDGLHQLLEAVGRSRRLVVLTGAGCSTGSGIPDYRDRDGEWKRKPPVRFQQFIGSAETRKRYWARSMVGWKLVESAQPNAAHEALAAIEVSGRLRYLVTQNVDGLHQKAGSVHVNDLHGRVDRVRCLFAPGLKPVEHSSNLVRVGTFSTPAGRLSFPFIFIYLESSMFGSCRMCFSPTDKWQDFCNECATRDVPERPSLEVAPRPRLHVIRGGKSGWERPRSKKSGNRWLTPVSSPRPPET